MSAHGDPTPMTSHAAGPLSGEAHVPGDKSISHRSLILGAMTVGETTVTGLLEGQDVLDTAKAMAAFGAEIDRTEDGTWHIHGVGTGGFREPEDVINCGNAGTGVRLIMGAMATTPITATFTGDHSLRSRPMGRITDPLALFGAASYGRRGGRLPLTLVGAGNAVPVNYSTPVASAQIKSAVLLAGLNAPGETVVTEEESTRDHTERMLTGFGAEISTEMRNQGRRITLIGQPELKPQAIVVPRDPSSAAFPVCAALITKGSDVLVPNIGLNPTRAGLFDVLRQMGGDIIFQNERTVGGEPVADLKVKHSELTGINIPAEIAPSMIDEFPILFVAAAMASGTTTTNGLHELRVKESDRLTQMAEGLKLIGANITEKEDGLIINGNAGTPLRGGNNQSIETALDHRIAMSFAIAGLTSQSGARVDDMRPVETSFPGFSELLQRLTEA
mgnify:CR=1 FL=1